MTDPSERIFVAFDTETTGLKAAKGNVVEIAGVRFTGTGDEISRFSTLANPGGPMNPDVIKIHGINDSMVSRAPTPSKACLQFANWLHEEDVLVAHNATFDVGFISTELTRGGHEAPKNSVVDTLKLTRFLQLPVANYKLGTLVEHFDFPETGYHRAMADSLYVMQLMVELIKKHPAKAMLELMRRSTVSNHHSTAPGTVGLAPRFSHLPAAMTRGDVLTMRYDGERPQRILPLTFAQVGKDECLLAQCLSDGSVREFELKRIIALCSPENDLLK